MLGLNLDYVIARARAFARSEEGASAIEYAIVVAMVAMVAVVVVAFITPIGERILAIFDSILNALPAATP